MTGHPLQLVASNAYYHQLLVVINFSFAIMNFVSCWVLYKGYSEVALLIQAQLEQRENEWKSMPKVRYINCVVILIPNFSLFTIKLQMHVNYNDEKCPTSKTKQYSPKHMEFGLLVSTGRLMALKYI